MPLPGDITTITVTGTLLSYGGVPMPGSVVFTPSVQVTDVTGNVILTPQPIIVPLVNGTFSVVLPCTDDPTLNPTGFTYYVDERVPDGTQYSISIPRSLGASVDLSHLAQIPAVTPTAQYLPLPSGTPTAGYVPIATGSGEASSWGPVGAPLPADQGLIGWAYDSVSAANASNQPAAGTIIAVRIKVPAATISNLWVGINSSGSGLTSGENFAGLYSGDGSSLLSATADQSTAWQSGFLAVPMALTVPQTVPAGYVYVAWYANGTTIPKFQWAGSANVVNANLTNATARFAHAQTGRTTSLPASLALGMSGDAYWAAVS